MAFDDPNRPHRYMVKKTDLLLDIWFLYPEHSLHEVILLALAGKQGPVTDDEFVEALDKMREKR